MRAPTRKQLPIFRALVPLVACLLLLSGCGASDDALLRSYHPDLQSSADIEGDPFVVGTVTTSDGQPAKGTVVTLEAWPSNHDVEELGPGEEVPVMTVAKALVDADGRFELRIADESMLNGRYNGSEGHVNFDAIAHTKDGPVVLSSWCTSIDHHGNSIAEGDTSREGPIEGQIDHPATVQEVIALEAEEPNPAT